MAEACAAVLGGGTISGIRREWTKLGLKPPQQAQRGTTTWNRTSIRMILLNPRIAGLSAYHGEIVGQGDWEPLVPEETWRAVRGTLDDPTRKPPRGVRTLLGGLGLCPCGNVVTGMPSHTGHHIYRCTPATPQPGLSRRACGAAGRTGGEIRGETRRGQAVPAEWAAIAHEVMHRTGLSPYGQEDEAVRWIAVRHGDDHIHLAAMLARQDGGKPSLSWERYKVRAACLAAEQRYGLRSTAPADRTAARRPSRAENEKAARRGLGEAPRITLRRQVTTAAAAAGSEGEFFARLDQAGVLVRKRFNGQRGRVLHPPGPGRGAGAQAVQRQQPRSGHRVLGRPARRHRQGRRTDLVRRRETRGGPELAQAAAAVEPASGPCPERT